MQEEIEDILEDTNQEDPVSQPTQRASRVSLVEMIWQSDLPDSISESDESQEELINKKRLKLKAFKIQLPKDIQVAHLNL